MTRTERPLDRRHLDTRCCKKCYGKPADYRCGYHYCWCKKH